MAKNSYKHWSKSELKELRSNKSHKSLSKLLKRTKMSIQTKRSKMGINLSKISKRVFKNTTNTSISASSTINIKNAKTIVVTPEGVNIKF